ncbi:uncharacterized protein B0H18DRAFT_957099 [Fomitopsis serialis]|uniref:uncharacterized protein n=1 Tax=Fomitopsis serialis TaxID=139415 RepID=UPI002008B01C|nr:uncharacterized protein B0H18DRAFT_957099 [Neoantrodia serialis]KAH9920396.1 hypothetical protein B0H18DRAFT_957099 [Neoantrodia serialis]
MAVATQLVLNGTDHSLELLDKNTLWHLCHKYGCRRYGNVKRLRKALLAYRAENNLGGHLTGSISRHNPIAASRDEQQRGLEAEMLVVRAEKAWQQGKSAKTLVNSHTRTTLVGLCARHALATDGTKKQLVDRLMQVDHDVVPSTDEVPSWVDPAPRNFGTKQRGKLSADQWFSVCTINLPFTLIRIWGDEQGRRRAMLQNYMDLMTAVVMSSMLAINDSHVKAYEEAIVRYLRSLKDLYKASEFKPNHHMALHVGAFLRRFGPVHSIRTFFSERMNFMLQRINTNRKFGELELTFMKTACRSANLRALLRADGIRNVVKDFTDMYDGLFNENKRGTRLRETLLGDENERRQATVQEAKSAVALDNDAFKAFISLLNTECTMESFVDIRELRLKPGLQQMVNTVVDCTSLFLHGVTYKAAAKSPKDSNIVFSHPGINSGEGEHCAGRIKQIFVHRRRSSGGDEMREVFLFPLKTQAATITANFPTLEVASTTTGIIASQW